MFNAPSSKAFSRGKGLGRVKSFFFFNKLDWQSWMSRLFNSCIQYCYILAWHPCQPSSWVSLIWCALFLVLQLFPITCWTIAIITVKSYYTCFANLIPQESDHSDLATASLSFYAKISCGRKDWGKKLKRPASWTLKKISLLSLLMYKCNHVDFQGTVAIQKWNETWPTWGFAKKPTLRRSYMYMCVKVDETAYM